MTTFNMEKPIELFLIIKKVRQTLNICPSKSGKNLQFTAKNLLILMAQLFILLSEVSFLLLEATSIAEYGMCFSVFSLALMNIVFYSINIAQIKNIEESIGYFENFVEMSKLNCLMDSCFHTYTLFLL